MRQEENDGKLTKAEENIALARLMIIPEGLVHSAIGNSRTALMHALMSQPGNENWHLTNYSYETGQYSNAKQTRHTLKVAPIDKKYVPGGRPY